MRELERTKKAGLRGTIIQTLQPEDLPPYRDRIYDPFWARAQEMGIPVTPHSIAGRAPDPLHFHTRAEQENAPTAFLRLFSEIGDVLANEFIFGRILDRFPTLKIVTSEYEVSWLPHYMWRLDQMQGAFSARLPLPKLDGKASDYIRQRIWHGTVDDPYAQDVVDNIGGPGRVMWGSDFPHIRSIGVDAHARLAKLFEHLAPQAQQALVAGNVAGLYGL